MPKLSFASTFCAGFLVGLVLTVYEVLELGHINGSIASSFSALKSNSLSKNVSDYKTYVRSDDYFLAKTNFEDNMESQNKAINASVKLLCWAMTYPDNHQEKAKFVMQSWGKRCDKFFFVSEGQSDDDSGLPIVVVDAPSGREGLWPKVRLAFLHIHKHFGEQYDWFMKADDDTFVDVLSLKRFLFAHDSEAPLFFGEQFISAYGQRYMSGGGGYVLSRKTLFKFIELLEDKRTDEQIGCDRSRNTSEEDPSISFCLMNILKVKGTDSRDLSGMNRFSQHSGAGREKLWNSKSLYYWNYQHYKSTQINGSVGCCSNTMISFHYQNSELMFMNEFLIYSVNPDDTSLTLRRIPPPFMNVSKTES